MGLSGLSFLVKGCGVDRMLPTTTASVSPVPSSTPFLPSTEIPTPIPTSTPTYSTYTAIARAATYDHKLLRDQVQTMLESLGVGNNFIRPGARIGIKPNLTGGTWWDSSLPVPSTELFVVHPALVQVLAEILLDAGAGKIYIMEGLGDPTIYPTWGYTDIARYLNAELIDLCSPSPYSDFAMFPVGEKRLVYDVFYMNGLLGEIDTFISVAKMKCHSTSGVTLAQKNLFGIPPISLYRDSEEDNNRSSFHESTIYDRRVPRVIVDLNMARPIHFSLIDGIMTAEAGAGPWDKNFNPVRPGLLVAGKDTVAVDAVSTALMGFDPNAPSGTRPFDYADNHIALAHEMGLGTNQLNEIGILGTQIADAIFPFKTAR
jgi:uncharacterized protein (DUF362 family)